jgi:hypothetical protein
MLLSCNAFTQQSESEKLLYQITEEPNDTSKIKLLIQLGMRYDTGDSLSGIYLKEAYDLSVKNNFRYGLAYGQYYKVLELTEKGRYDEAIAKCIKCIDAIDSMHLVVGGPLVNIRFWYNYAGKQEEKFRYYSEKAVYYKLYGPAENLAVCYHSISGYYYYLADYDKAIEYLMRSRDLCRYSDSSDWAGESQIIGSMYMEWGNLDKAEELLVSGRKDLVRLNIIQNSFFYYQKLGEIYYLRHDCKKALGFFNDSRKFITVPYEKALNFVSFAKVYLDLDSTDSVKYYLNEAENVRHKEGLRVLTPQGDLEIDYYFYRYFRKTNNENFALSSLETALNQAKSSKYIPLILKYTKELHAYFLQRNDSIQSLRYLIQARVIEDSIYRMNTRARIASYEIEEQQQQKENEIGQLQVQNTTQRNYYLLGGAFLLLLVLAGISLFRYKRKRDEELLKSEFKKQLAKAETVALRAQMNPHFIFNCLNSINSFVIDQDHEKASEYLIKFSKLIRLILDNSRSETISLDKELETLKLYILLESARFDNKFSWEYHIAEDMQTDSVMIPPMLLQPFVENAIWHGLMQKEGAGMITIEIRTENEEFLNISITDDGIGREKAAELKSKSASHKSHGLKVTSQRIEMMYRLNSTGAHVNIFDLKDENGRASGTRVELIIPF